MNILILCTGNSCRSQMAHAYLAEMLGTRANIYSAGVETHGVNPRAIKTMAEDDIDISGYTSNHVAEYAEVDFDYIITVCDSAKARCPVFPSTAKQIHHSFQDPAKAEGTEAEIMASFKATRNEIKAYLIRFIGSYF